MGRMGSLRVVLFTTVCAFVLIPVLSGSFVGAVDFTTSGSGDRPTPGTGTAELSVQSVPAESIELERGDFGAETYHLVAPSARVAVRSVTGNPVLRYNIDIPGLDVLDTTRYELHGRAGQTLQLSFRPFEISPRIVDQSRYNATVSLVLQSGQQVDEIIYQHEVVIHVVA